MTEQERRRGCAGADGQLAQRPAKRRCARQHPDGRALIIGDAPGFAIHYWDGTNLLSHFDMAGPRNVIASYNSNLQPMMKAFLQERGTG